jgi:hypothetical protein
MPYIAGGADGAVSSYFFIKYRDDPKQLVEMFTNVVLPTSVFLKSIFSGSIKLLLQATNFNGLKELWKRYVYSQSKTSNTCQ